MPSTTKGSKRSGSGSRRSPEPHLDQRSREVQRFGALRLLPIGLSAAARGESAELLNRLLADTTILYALYKKHHWNVAGPTFYQLHLLFDKHADEQLELIDVLAERVQTLGGIAVGDPRHAAELTRIERAPDGAEDVPAMISRTLAGHLTIIEAVRVGIDKTEKSGDWGSNDLLMSDVLRRNELQVLVPVRAPGGPSPRRRSRRGFIGVNSGHRKDMSMISWLRSMGITSNAVYAGSMASILLSLALWFLPRGNGDGAHDRPEHFALFVGLWPPTLAVLASAIRQDELRDTD